LSRQSRWVEPFEFTDGRSIALGVPYTVQPFTVTTP
jgi:hypothetical protein